MGASSFVLDEKIVHAPAHVVWKALLDELRGAQRFWVPDNTFEPGTPGPEVIGGTTRVTVHTRGYDKRGLKIGFTAQTTEVVVGRRIAYDYVDGALRGHAVFQLVPVGAGRTKIWMRFEGRTVGRFKPLAKVVPKEHTKAMKAAFERLAALVWTESPAAEPAAQRELVTT